MMVGFVSCLLIIAIAMGIAFFRISLWLWTTLGIGFFFLFAKLHWLGWLGYLCFAFWVSLSILVNLPWTRRVFTRKILGWFSKQVPPMSSTEREAIEAGDLWWEKELFQGKPNWKLCLAVPSPILSAQEQSFLDNEVSHLCQMLNDWQIVHENCDLSPQTWEYLKTQKFFGLIIPKKYGGLEFSPFANSSIITKIATRSISCAVTAMVPNSLGPAELLLHYGTPEQKDYYLPRLADGREIPCFGLTSPEAGSDAGAIPDVGIICQDQFQGKEVLGIRLNFDKRYITLAPCATLMGLAFKLYDPQQLFSEKVEWGITVCLLPLSHPGIEVGNRHFPLNLAFMNGPVRGKDVFIPLDWIIGGTSKMGQGWAMLMECLSAGRGISLPALSTSTGVLTYRMTGAYAAIRKQFNLPIGQFEGVEEKLATIGGLTYTLQAMRHFTCSALCQGMKPSVATAISKYQMTEMSRVVINHAMDIHGGRGIMMGPQNYIARGYEAIPVSITVEGANILTRSLIIFGQGALRCHPHLFEELRAVEMYKDQPKKAIKHFDFHFMKHTGYFLSNAVRCWIYGLTRGRFSTIIINDVTAPYIRKINWLSCALSFSADVALLALGQDLKRKERISGRFADILSQLYVASSVFKYYSAQHQRDESWPLAKWSFEQSLYTVQEAFYDLFDNFPIKGLGRLLKWMIFPWGLALRKPSDRLGQTMSQMMQTQNQIRENLTSLCYHSPHIQEATSLVEQTFQMLNHLQPVFIRLNKAIKDKLIEKTATLTVQAQQAFELEIVSKEEKNALLEYDLLRKKTIAVDEFKPEYALGNKQCIKPVLKQVV